MATKLLTQPIHDSSTRATMSNSSSCNSTRVQFLVLCHPYCSRLSAEHSSQSTDINTAPKCHDRHRITTSVDAAAAASAACLVEIDCWMSSEDEKYKSRGWARNCNRISTCTRSTISVDTARDPSAVLDSHVTLLSQVSAPCHVSATSNYDSLSVAMPLMMDDAQSLISTFVSSRLDYCNSLYCGITWHNFSYHKANRMQPFAFSRRPLKEHTTSVFRMLHWRTELRQVVLTRKPATSCHRVL